MKHIHRLIVTSATYRQSSRVTPQLLANDPDNRFLARGPRFRLDAETVRDTMLAASGLLARKMGGQSVFPPQPSIVTELAYGNTAWNVSTGEDRYRRSLYTFSKRTAPFAAYTVFDAPTGESCEPRRDRSNTPLQALTLLNDEMYLDMSRSLAKDAANLDAASPEERATYVFRSLLTRPPEASEVAALTDYYEAQRARLEASQLNAAEICGDKNASNDRAAWTLVARALMNLDEAITKP